MGETELEARVRELERAIKKITRDLQVARNVADAANQAAGLTRQANNGRPSIVFKAPVGGIAARSGTTLGSATCAIWTLSSSTISDSTKTDTVYNVSSSAVGASKYGIALRVEDVWMVIVESCA